MCPKGSDLPNTLKGAFPDPLATFPADEIFDDAKAGKALYQGIAKIAESRLVN
jgi:hypothetical protein